MARHHSLFRSVRGFSLHWRLGKQVEDLVDFTVLEVDDDDEGWEE